MYPIWVIGSESHYTILLSYDADVQKGSPEEECERYAREKFDALDSSGGGGFLDLSSLDGLLHDLHITLEERYLENFRNAGIVLWTEFWATVSGQLVDRERSRRGSEYRINSVFLVWTLLL